MVRSMAVIPPVPTRDDQFFWDGVAAGHLLLQRCGDCGVLRHPPQPMCGACGSLALDTQEATGRGTVFTWVLSGERIAVIVELEEGLRLVSNLVGIEPGQARIGMPVELEIVDLDGVTLPQFRPVA
jgi:uncharacterized OB-fold protein